MRTYKRKTNWLNSTGYTDGSSTSMNNSNTIPSNNITMNNTSQPLRAQGLDANGYPITNEILLEPGQEYDFGNVGSVVEKPIFQDAGQFFLNNTNKMQPNTYYNTNGMELKSSRPNNTSTFFGNFFNSPTTGFLNQYTPNSVDNPNYGISPNYGNVSNQSGTTPATPLIYTEPSQVKQNNTTPTVQSQPTEQPTNTAIQTESKNQSIVGSTNWLNTQITEMKDELNNLEFGSPEYERLKQQVSIYENTLNPSLIQQEGTSTATPVNANDPERFQFHNPYGGMDLGSASYMFGNAVQSGNTEQAVLSGLKLGTGLARNIFSGLGFANRNKQVASSYAEQQRDALTQNNRVQSLQDGGEVADPVQEVAQILAEGSTPEEVVQMLVQNGVPQEQAIALVEQASQMFKFGGMLKSKKVKNYKLNEKTGNYEVEFE